MRVSMMIRSGLVGFAVAALAACSDTPVMPHAERSIDLQGPAYARADHGPRAGHGPKATSDPLTSVRRNGDRNAAIDSGTFTLTSQGGTFQLGLHTLIVPPGALCDLSSPYGTAYFDDASSCVKPAAPIQVKAVWSTRRGHAYVEFEPALRFDPAADAPPVILALHDKQSVDNGSFQILWLNEDGQWVDESLTDPTLRTFVFGRDVVARRIKHFSGYNVSASLDDAFMMY